MHVNLIGVWSADARFGPGAQSDEILVFKPDGTGWLEIWNFYLCSVDFFEWTIASPGRITINGIKSLELDENTNELIDSANRIETKHVPYQIQQEDTPSGKTMKVLRIKIVNLGDGAFGFFSDENAEKRIQRILESP